MRKKVDGRVKFVQKRFAGTRLDCRLATRQQLPELIEVLAKQAEAFLHGGAARALSRLRFQRMQGEIGDTRADFGLRLPPSRLEPPGGPVAHADDGERRD